MKLTELTKGGYYYFSLDASKPFPYAEGNYTTVTLLHSSEYSPGAKHPLAKYVVQFPNGNIEEHINLDRLLGLSSEENFERGGLI